MMINVFNGKKVQLLKPYWELMPITLKVETGELLNGSGKALEFGKDYILIDEETEGKRVRIYNQYNELIQEILFND